MLELRNFSFGYEDKLLFEDINIQFEEGKSYSLVGDSGIGKTTLLSILSSLIKPEPNKIFYNGQDIATLNLAKYRRDNIAIIFQSYNLINYLNAYENALQGYLIKNKKADENTRQEVKDLLTKLNIDEETQKLPIYKLSGGQQQRVAVARAILTDAKIILCDEPTGNLDDKNTAEITTILLDLAKEHNKIVIIVTHNNAIAEVADVKYRIENRKIF